MAHVLPITSLKGIKLPFTFSVDGQYFILRKRAGYYGLACKMFNCRCYDSLVTNRNESGVSPK